MTSTMLVQHHFTLLVVWISINFVFIPNSTEPKSLPELPSEHDDFESMRAQNKVYVDKSEYLMKLLQRGDRFFRMCRPGRFGKSSFLQMVKSFFRGRKELFEGLEIYDKHDWQSSYPVILLDFSAMNISTPESFATSLEREIMKIAKSYEIRIDETLPLAPDDASSEAQDSKTGQLLDHLLKDGQKVVLLVDEYDYPLRKYFQHYDYYDFEPSNHFYTVTRDFFRQFERRLNQIEFLFFTCTTVTPWRRYYNKELSPPELEPIVLKDISYDPQFSQMMGLTGDELETRMGSHINATIINYPNQTFRNFVEKLRKRYNGFCFSANDVKSGDRKCRLYNLHSAMSCLRNNSLDYFWHPAGDSNLYNVFHDNGHIDKFYRFQLPRYKNFFRMGSFIVPRRYLDNETILSKHWRWNSDRRYYSQKRNIAAMCLLQFGYVTIQDYYECTDKFVVNFPNEETRDSYLRATLELIFGRKFRSSKEFFQQCSDLRESMLAGNGKDIFERLHEMVSKSKPYTFDLHILVDEVFQICHFSLREILDDEDSMKVEYLFYDDTLGKLRAKPRFYGMEVTLSRQTASRFKFEFEDCATDAMNAALNVVNEEDFREASRNRTTHLFGINVNANGDWIDEWIKMTYFDGKFSDVQASIPVYVDMYQPYVKHEPYSPVKSSSKRSYVRKKLQTN